VPTYRAKAFAYITHGQRLLVFRQPGAPEAGLQVPAGTIHPGETPAAAVLREALEETGLPDLELVRFLGIAERDMAEFGRDEVAVRHFFHLACHERPPETWQHFEGDPSEGGPGPILFELFWVELPDGVPPLIADHDAMMPRLLESLGARGQWEQPYSATLS
jgi:8-oxo-dGTP pyrophosphatase MutT (NUDIX family)